MDTLESFIPEDAQRTLIFFVNGKKVVEPRADPEWTLLWYLRRRLGLPGTKYGCGEGGCGACTVMLSRYLPREDRIKHIAVNACLTPVCAVHGLAVSTVEGIGSTQERLHPVQERMAKAHGSQCGFCTPGIVMSMYSLLRQEGKINYEDIETALQGNLCRCTGYRPIIEGLKTFIEGGERCYVNGDNNTNISCAMGTECCKVKKEDEINGQVGLFDKSSFRPYDSSQEPIFPPELKINRQFYDSFLFFRGENAIWVRPKSLQDILILKQILPESKIVAGNTEVGVEIKVKKKIYPVLLSPSAIPEMEFCNLTRSGIEIGASVTLSDLATFLQNVIKTSYVKGKIYDEINNMLHWFAGNQVRNVASLIGNIITASPISDLNPILLACSAKLNVLSSKKGNRKIIMDDNFFEGYRKTAVSDDEIVVSIEIPFSEDDQFFKAYKQARRRDDDISIVTAACNVKFERNSNIVSEAKLCFGGMAPTTKCAVKTSEMLKGKPWNQKTLHSVFDSLTREFVLDASSPGGMAEYRKSLCLSLFFRFFIYVLKNLKKQNGFVVPSTHFSGLNGISSALPKSSQYFEIKNCNRKATDTIGLPVPHTSAMKQVTGEAVYVDDIPHVQGELFLCLVFSSQAFAKIKNIDANKALALPGVVAFLSAADLDVQSNKVGSIIKDEEIFCSEMVFSRACVIGAIVAESESIARRAKELVLVEYEPLEPVLVTLEEAISHKSFFPGYPKPISKGDIDKAFKTSTHVREGFARTGAQEHFYLETMSAFAIRKEDELEISCTAQGPTQIATMVSEALRIPNHKVISKVKRIGGGFGGKETKASMLALPTAVAAYKLKKPVRAVFERDEDMQVMGYRHPFLITYKVAFNDDGKIIGVVYNIYCNAGYSVDISGLALERAMFHVDNCYFVPNVEINMYLCKTNMPSNTAFRGFGAPKAMFAAEKMIRDVADALNKSYEEIVHINMYREGDLTHFGQPLVYCTISRCWQECIQTSSYWQRKKEVEEFNRMNRWKKKGITLVPTKFGISFGSDMFMQGAALMLVYLDGSVLLSIGGIEMGQGLYTKMVQVASKVLEIDINKIHISETATNHVPNASPTAASISSDLYGMAVLNACDILNDRLKPFKTKNPKGKWEDWVTAAYMDRVSLSVTGFYYSPKIEYDRARNSGAFYEYFTYGAACSEVIVDCLTGDHEVLRTDIVMDVGESLNPAIDIGQIEGAFMQGYGFFTLEEMVFSPKGEVISRGPGAYKIPGISDVPKQFNVSLLKGAPNPRAVYSSKAIGEPPLFLAASVFFAIKEAIRAAREDSGAPPEVDLQPPATCARIRMACEDEITKQVKPTVNTACTPWSVTS